MPCYSAQESLDTALTGRRVGMFHLVSYLRDGDRVFETAYRAAATTTRAGYFLAGSKYGLVPAAWSVTSTTRSISETAWVIATSIPWLRVTVAIPQP